MTQDFDGNRSEAIAVPEERPAQSGFLRGFLEVVQALAIAVLISVGLNLFVVQVTEVRQRSMESTLDHGDRVLVSKVDYRLHPAERGDIVVFHPPTDTSIPFVKRVIAVGGDTIEIRDGKVFVNGTQLDEPYVIGATQGRSIRYPHQVPPGSVFVMGDNRTVSGDSREWGAVREKDIIGKVILRFWPLNKAYFFEW
jgi:signal peptidase I